MFNSILILHQICLQLTLIQLYLSNRPEFITEHLNFRVFPGLHMNKALLFQLNILTDLIIAKSNPETDRFFIQSTKNGDFSEIYQDTKQHLLMWFSFDRDFEIPVLSTVLENQKAFIALYTYLKLEK